MIMDATSELHSRIQDDVHIYNLGLNPHYTEKKSLLKDHSSDFSDSDDPELTELLRLIECPVCKDVPNPPIYNCNNGHFTCDSCRSRLISQNCAYCLAEFTRMRNYPLEALVSTPAVKCDFTKFGCSHKRLSLSEYEEHVKKCWAKLWRPGKVIKNSKMSEELHPSYYTDDDMELSPCPRCNHDNPPRKVKCQTCNCSLRVPTPMFLPFDSDSESLSPSSSFSSDFDITLQVV